MSKWLKNVSGVLKTYNGKDIPNGTYKEVTWDLDLKFANNSNLLTDIGNGDVLMAKDDSGSTDITDVSQAIDFLKDKYVEESLPFASKKLPGNKSLFRRIHGIRLDLDGTLTSQKVTFVVPYASAKITSTEIISAVEGDQVDFKVLDTAAGTVTTVPNYPLNQFGYGVYPSVGRYEQRSEYDADLFLGLQLEITVTPCNTDVRSIYFNLVLHEVV